MSRALTVLAGLALAACPRPGAPAPAVPAAPVLEVVDGVQRRRLFSLRGLAAADVTVRLFADSACAGPVYLESTGAELQEGLTVVLIAGLENQFSANAVSGLGATSACSAPIQVTYVPAGRPARPTVRAQPDSPSVATVFTLSGTTDPLTRVQRHEDSCTTPVLAELSAEAFALGFAVEVLPNTSRMVALNAVNEDAASDCATVRLTNDTLPPRMSVRLASPSPSVQQMAYVLLDGEFELTWLFFNSDCDGVQTSWNMNTTLLLPQFPFDATTPFSVLTRDRAGNTACVAGDRPWVSDASLPEEEAMVLVPQPPLFGNPTPPLVQVPWGRARVQVFLSADCNGVPLIDQSALQTVINDLYFTGPLDAGFLSARSVRLDGGLDPCSNAVEWPSP